MSDKSTLFIVNPQAGNTGKNWEKKYQQIQKHIDHQSEFLIADGIGIGREMTVDNSKSGDYDQIVAVGGEGTVNEIVNGIYETGTKIPLGFIWGGTFNDYLQEISYPKSLEEQVNIINRGEIKNTPLVRVTGDKTRMAMNIADIGLTANVAKMGSVDRDLLWVKGGLRISLLTLKAIIKWKNIPVSIKLDDGEISGDLALLMAGFSRQIANYKVLPHAELYGEKMAYAFATNFGKIKMIKFMKPLREGTHTANNVDLFMGYSKNITIDAETDLIVEVDGEPFSYNSSKVTLETVQNAINIIK